MGVGTPSRDFTRLDLVLLADDVHAEFDAFIADEYGRARDKLAHLVLALAAERAVQGVLGVASAHLAHSLIQFLIRRLKRAGAILPLPNPALLLSSK